MLLKQRQDVLVPVFVPASLPAFSEVPSEDAQLPLVLGELLEQHLDTWNMTHALKTLCVCVLRWGAFSYSCVFK